MHNEGVERAKRENKSDAVAIDRFLCKPGRIKYKEGPGDKRAGKQATEDELRWRLKPEEDEVGVGKLTKAKGR